MREHIPEAKPIQRQKALSRSSSVGLAPEYVSQTEIRRHVPNAEVGENCERYADRIVERPHSRLFVIEVVSKCFPPEMGDRTDRLVSVRGTACDLRGRWTG